MLKKNFFYFILLLMIFSGCKQEEFHGVQGEGVVEYEIIYLKNTLDKIPENLLPKKMTFTFSSRYTVSTIENYGGIITIKNINDLKKDTTTTIFKFFNHKYYYTSKPKEEPCCFEILENPEIKFLDDSIQLANLNCKKAELTFSSSNATQYLYYTDVIDAEIVNKNTVFDKIPGILMQFQMELGNLEMLFKATKIDFKPIEEDEFRFSSGYKKISRDEMVKIINELLE